MLKYNKQNEEFDKTYDIRLAERADIDSIMLFINDNWHEGHIMSRNRELFEYEFLEKDGQVNFILAVNRLTNKIEGMCGFIKASHSKEKLDLWTSIWKVLDGCPPFLGTEIIVRMEYLTKCRHIIMIGANPDTAVRIMKKKYSYHDGKLRHFYKLGQPESFKIAKVIDNRTELIQLNKNRKNDFSIKEVYSFEELRKHIDSNILEERVPYKDLWYIEHRYYNYPIYKYKVWGLYINESIAALLITRRQEQFGHSVIRIVDYIGKDECFKCFTHLFDELLIGKETEYIDFYYNREIEKSAMTIGFSVIDERDKNIIPNYFNPYLRENIDIYYVSPTEDFFCCKADGDQDRPN